jgi:hypothetical protein
VEKKGDQNQEEGDAQKGLEKLGVVILACYPRAQEAEAGGLRVLGQSGLHSKTLSQKKI